MRAAISSEAPMKRRLIALRFNGGGGRAGPHPKGWKKVCKLMAPAKGDNMHFTGTLGFIWMGALSS